MRNFFIQLIILLFPITSYASNTGSTNQSIMLMQNKIDTLTNKWELKIQTLSDEIKTLEDDLKKMRQGVTTCSQNIKLYSPENSANADGSGCVNVP